MHPAHIFSLNDDVAKIYADTKGNALIVRHIRVAGCHAFLSTVRYLGIEVDDALALAEKVDI